VLTLNNYLPKAKQILANIYRAEGEINIRQYLLSLSINFELWTSKSKKKAELKLDKTHEKSNLAKQPHLKCYIHR